MAQSLENAETILKEIYFKTSEFYEIMAPKLKNSAYGFRILYSPLKLRPPVMFIGYQPGGCNRESERAHEVHWPERMQYVTETWHLALKIRDIFEETFLDDCVATNAVFFRSPNVRAFKSNEAQVVSEISNFSQNCLKQIISVIEPMRIIYIGMSAASLMRKNDFVVRSSPKDRVLAQGGDTFGIPSLAVLHLSGCWISRVDMNQIKMTLRDFAIDSAINASRQG